MTAIITAIITIIIMYLLKIKHDKRSEEVLPSDYETPVELDIMTAYIDNLVVEPVIGCNATEYKKN